MKQINLLIVDNSAFMQQFFADIVSQDSRLNIVGKAENGLEAIAILRSIRPDVIILDIEMPLMDGIETLKKIMKKSPIPTIILCDKEITDQTVEALQLGAIDFITKPFGKASAYDQAIREEIVNKIKIAATTSSHLNHNQQYETITFSEDIKNLVLIGTSTGGPKALNQIIPNIKPVKNTAFLIVQHMPPGFTKSLAERLDNVSSLNVKEAEKNETIKEKYAYVAPGDYHLTIDGNMGNYKIVLTQDSLRNGHRPSVDTMIESVYSCFKGRIIIVIMTGMGSDGAKAISEIKEIKEIKNNIIIAESQESCIVFGMPHAAIKTGKVNYVCELDKIAQNINSLLTK